MPSQPILNYFQPLSVLPQLSILKPYGDRTAAVEFNRSDSSIFNLIVMGGEKISWN
jgi:hypothetical protein